MDDRKEGSRLAFQTEDLGPLLAEQLRQQYSKDAEKDLKELYLEAVKVSDYGNGRREGEM